MRRLLVLLLASVFVAGILWAQGTPDEVTKTKARLLGMCFRHQAQLDLIETDLRKVEVTIRKAQDLRSRAQAAHNSAAEQMATQALAAAEQTKANHLKRKQAVATSLEKSKAMLSLPDKELLALKLPEEVNDERFKLALQREREEYEKDYAGWLKKYQQALRERSPQSAEQRSEGLRTSLTTKAPPPPWKKLPALQAGDVLLVEPDSWLNDKLRLGDRLATQKWDSPACHTLVCVKELNGQHFFLDNQPGNGPQIISEERFLELYGHRFLHTARWAKDNETGMYVAEPLGPAAAKTLWDESIALAQKENQQNKDRLIKLGTSYGLGDDMVCSETSRWALIKAGRKVPTSGSGALRGAGIGFGPADFWGEQHFIVTPLGQGFK